MSALKNKRNIRQSANIAGGFCGERFGSRSWLAQKGKLVQKRKDKKLCVFYGFVRKEL